MTAEEMRELSDRFHKQADEMAKTATETRQLLKDGGYDLS